MGYTANPLQIIKKYKTQKDPQTNNNNKNKGYAKITIYRNRSGAEDMGTATNSNTTLGQLTAGYVSSAKPWGYCDLRRDCEPEPCI